MFRDKEFNLAFLISLLWHLFLLFAVTIVVLPTGFPMAKVSTVSFLGPLLEKTAFEIMVDKNRPSKQTAYKRSMYFENSFLDHRGGNLSLKFKDVAAPQKEEAAKITGKEFLDSPKITPPFLIPNLTQPAGRTGQGDFFIEGPLSEREVLSSPKLPVMSKRVEQGQRDFSVKLKVKVRPEGDVADASLLASSGYPDVDMAAINYMKGVRFSPMGSSLKGSLMGGEVKLSLKSR